MTGKDLILDVRNLVGDVPWRTSTANRIWTDQEIIDAANTARDLLIKLLWTQPRAQDTRPFQLTVSRMVQTGISTTADSGNVPAGFWRLLCGAGSDGHYIPAMTNEKVESYLEAGDDLITIRLGKFAGTAATATIVGLPQTPIANSSAPFTDFSDTFYETLELLTVNELLKKPERGVADRMDYLLQPISEALPLLT